MMPLRRAQNVADAAAMAGTGSSNGNCKVGRGGQLRVIMRGSATHPGLPADA